MSNAHQHLTAIPIIRTNRDWLVTVEDDSRYARQSRAQERAA